MSNELVIHYPTGSTLYALLFDATGQIYNGSTFGAPSAASWTDYDIAMSEVATATGIYRASMPAVAAGAYGWVVRKQAGGSPAVSDITVGTGEIRWTGTAEEAVPAAVNVTHHAGVAVAPADANGNVPVDVQTWRAEPPEYLLYGLVKSSTELFSESAKLDLQKIASFSIVSSSGNNLIVSSTDDMDDYLLGAVVAIEYEVAAP